MAQHILLLVVIGICVFHTTYGDHTSNSTTVLQPILIVSSFLLLYFCLVAMNLRMMIFCYLILEVCLMVPVKKKTIRGPR